MCHIKSCVLSCKNSGIFMLHKGCNHHSHEVIKFVYLFWKSLEIRTITNELQLNCAEYGLQIWLTSTKARRVLTLVIQPISDEECLENSTWSNEICVFTYDIRLICSHYRSKHILHKILNFVNLPSTYILSLNYLYSKQDPRKMTKYEHSVLTFGYIH